MPGMAIDLEVIKKRNGVMRWFLNGHGPASMLVTQSQVNAQLLIEADDIDTLLAYVAHVEKRYADAEEDAHSIRREIAIARLREYYTPPLRD